MYGNGIHCGIGAADVGDDSVGCSATASTGDADQFGHQHRTGAHFIAGCNSVHGSSAGGGRMQLVRADALDVASSRDVRTPTDV